MPVPCAADIAFQQQQIDQHCDVVEAMDLLGQTHAVDTDDRSRLRHRPAPPPRGPRGQAGLGVLDGRPFRGAHEGPNASKPCVCCSMKSRSSTLRPRAPGCVVLGSTCLQMPSQRGDVAAGLHLMVLARDRGVVTASASPTACCGLTKEIRPLLAHRIERHDLTAALHGILQRMQEPRTVRTGVLAEEEDRVDAGEILVNAPCRRRRR